LERFAIKADQCTSDTHSNRTGLPSIPATVNAYEHVNVTLLSNRLKGTENRVAILLVGKVNF
jgi:hypothetical protein